jgi:hypothetical protein
MSRKNLWQARLPPVLRHKGFFPYEWLLEHDLTWCCMHDHAALSYCAYRKLSTT